MAWIVGIDEAGYGPNLGPFVMSAAACRVPDALAAGPDLWELLHPAVRRGGGKRGDGRLLVDDSKVVHAGAHGLADLEHGVLAALAGAAPPPTLADLLAHLCPADRDDLCAEVWYSGRSPVPGHAPADEVARLAGLFREACAGAGVGDWRAWSVVLCPARFNALVEAAGSKSAVLAHGFTRLLGAVRDLPRPGEPLAVFVDKQGGRNAYAAQVQQGLPGGMVLAVEETAARSRYVVRGLPRPLQLTFQPRADAEHFCVALASMASKYLRERLMGEFNSFWQGQLPGLKPTAGYPGDAARFLEAIRPHLPRLGLSDDAVWRSR